MIHIHLEYTYTQICDVRYSVCAEINNKANYVNAKLSCEVPSSSRCHNFLQPEQKHEKAKNQKPFTLTGLFN